MTHLAPVCRYFYNIMHDSSPLDVSFKEYRVIFGDFDEEDTGGIEEHSSNIDFEGIDEDGGESNEEIGNEGAAVSHNEEPQKWKADISNIVDKLSAPSGISVDVGADPKANDFFTFMFGEDLFDKIVEETNRFACQKLVDKQRLVQWQDVTKVKVKGYFGMCVIMRMNILPKVANYWWSDIFMGNEGIK